jgi:hypothetical protein
MRESEIGYAPCSKCDQDKVKKKKKKGLIYLSVGKVAYNNRTVYIDGTKSQGWRQQVAYNNRKQKSHRVDGS